MRLLPGETISTIQSGASEQPLYVSLSGEQITLTSVAYWRKYINKQQRFTRWIKVAQSSGLCYIYSMCLRIRVLSGFLQSHFHTTQRPAEFSQKKVSHELL